MHRRAGKIRETSNLYNTSAVFFDRFSLSGRGPVKVNEPARIIGRPVRRIRDNAITSTKLVSRRTRLKMPLR